MKQLGRSTADSPSLDSDKPKLLVRKGDGKGSGSGCGGGEEEEERCRCNLEQWTTESTTHVFPSPPSRFFKGIEQHCVRLPTKGGAVGETTLVDDWYYHIPDRFVNVLAVDAAGKFLVFRQTKYAVTVEFGTTTLATVGGQVDEGEAPEACARRELLEETGLVASEMVSLGSYVLNANRGCGVGHLFAALGASHQEDSASGGEPASASSSSALDGGDDLEEMEAMWLTRDELEDAVSANEFKSGTWALTCLLALSRLDRRARVAAAETAAVASEKVNQEAVEIAN